MAIRATLKTAYLGEINGASDSAELEEVASDLNAEYAADADIAKALADKRGEFTGPAGKLTDSELVDQVIARDAVRAQFGLDAEGKPVQANDDVVPALEVKDGKVTFGEASLAVADGTEVDTEKLADYVVVAKTALTDAKSAQVSDERLDALRAVATTLGAENAADMDFDAVVARIADDQDKLVAKNQTIEGDGNEAESGEMGLDALQDFYRDPSAFYLQQTQ